MTDRERLINELKKAKTACLIKEGGGCLACTHRGKADCTLENIADHLLANGVIVPPCKVGDMVWFIRKDIKSEIIETNVEKVVLKHGGLYIKLGCNAMYETTCNSIGKTVFLTKEEAERALKEREQV